MAEGPPLYVPGPAPAGSRAGPGPRTSPATSRYEVAAAVAASLVLGALYLYGCAFSASIQDTARDVYYAYSIRRGLWFPLEGPILGGAIHLGPAWYYLMALPMWLSSSWLSVALFAGFLAALKFPLAIALGSRLLDVRFGILWACALALPSWNTVEQLIFFNPNPAAAAVLGAMLLWDLCRRQPRWGRFLALGAVIGLSIHFHPTTVPLMLLGLHAAWKGRWRLALVGALVLGLALPLAPYIAHQWMSGMPDLQRGANYVHGDVSLAYVANVLPIAASVIFGGASAMLACFWGLPSWASTGLALLPCAAMAFALAALIPRAVEPAYRRLLGALVLALGCGIAWVSVLRATTPCYFVYALAPLASGLVALGLHRAFASRMAMVLLFLASAAALGATSIQIARTVDEGEGRLTLSVLDIKAVGRAGVAADVWFPAASRSRLGAFLCAQPAASSLHGHLAYIEDRAVGVDALLACGTLAHLGLVGRAHAADWAGMSRRFWSAAAAAPECWIGSLGMMRPSVVASGGDPVPIADGRIYFPRAQSHAPLVYTKSTFTTAGGEFVLVTNPFLGYEMLRDVTATVNGTELRPIASNDLSVLYAAPAGTAQASWEIRFAASDSRSIDVVTFARQRQAASACR